MAKLGKKTSWKNSVKKKFNSTSTAFVYSRSVIFDELNVPDMHTSHFDAQAYEEGFTNLFADVDVSAPVIPRPPDVVRVHNPQYDDELTQYN